MPAYTDGKLLEKLSGSNGRMGRARPELDKVTYALFDIDPAEYYGTRFLHPERVDVDQVSLASKASIIMQKLDYLLDAIEAAEFEGPFKALEVGCGSGRVGAWVKHRFPECRLFGVDLSADCIAVAREHGFEEALAHDVIRSLPYPDEYFDFVYTMDFFGHVEFARKDGIISEIRRVTRRGGYGYHGIEAGFVDYLNCDPQDPEDEVRKYVWVDGHIGVESTEELVERFSRHFDVLSAFPWPIRPFLNIDTVLASDLYGKDFAKTLEHFDSYNSRVCMDVALGHCCKEITAKLLAALGPILTPSAMKRLGGGPVLDRLSEAFLMDSGFAILRLQRPAERPARGLLGRVKNWFRVTRSSAAE